MLNQVSFVCYLFQVETNKVKEALNDESWDAMHEKLHQFIRNYVWELVHRPEITISLKSSRCSRTSQMNIEPL